MAETNVPNIRDIISSFPVKFSSLLITSYIFRFPEKFWCSAKTLGLLRVNNFLFLRQQAYRTKNIHVILFCYIFCRSR